MHAVVVMLIALGGLGCQNPASTAPPALPAVEVPASQPATPAVSPLSDVGPTAPLGDVSTTDNAPPPPYPVYSGGPFANAAVPEDDSFRTCLRNTFCSFFIGKDPGVPTAREIEAAYGAGLYNH
jgi:hypothetical protein